MITVRFQESQRYDINTDSDMTRFMATTSIGSYWSEVPSEGPISLRLNREKFKQMAVEYIRAGSLPCEIRLEEGTEQ